MSYGTQTYGTETYNSDALGIGQIEPATVERRGGTKVTLRGVFPIDQTYVVRVDGIAAYSGVPGQGAVIRTDGDSLSFVTPPLALSQIGAVTVEVETVPGAETVDTTLTVVEQSFGSAQFAMRRLFPAWYGVGPRRLGTEPQEQ